MIILANMQHVKQMKKCNDKKAMFKSTIGFFFATSVVSSGLFYCYFATLHLHQASNDGDGQGI